VDRKKPRVSCFLLPRCSTPLVPFPFSPLSLEFGGLFRAVARGTI
jgi:hypothetical protein